VALASPFGGRHCDRAAIFRLG